MPGIPLLEGKRKGWNILKGVFAGEAHRQDANRWKSCSCLPVDSASGGILHGSSGGLRHRQRDPAGLSSPLLGAPSRHTTVGCTGLSLGWSIPGTWMGPPPTPAAPVPLHSTSLLISFLGLTLFYFIVFYL